MSQHKTLIDLHKDIEQLIHMHVEPSSDGTRQILHCQFLLPLLEEGKQFAEHPTHLSYHSATEGRRHLEALPLVHPGAEPVPEEEASEVASELEPEQPSQESGTDKKKGGKK